MNTFTLYVTHSLPWLLVLDDRSGPVYFPAKTTCPECGGKLLVQVTEWETATGIPTPYGVEIDCEADLEADLEDEDYEAGASAHRWWQSDWQPVRDVLVRWARRHLRRVEP